MNEIRRLGEERMMEKLCSECGHEIEWHSNTWGCMYSENPNDIDIKYCECNRTGDDVLADGETDYFEWTCSRCGAVLSSENTHCPCEYEVNNE
jgi:hypothetical protein